MNTKSGIDNQYLQRAIFDLIQNRFPRRADAVEELASLLSIGRNAIYRRLRGDSLLTMGELYTLTQYFDLSLDEIFQRPSQDKVVFSCSFFNRKVSSLLDYIHQIHDHATAFSELQDVQIYCTSQEIPIFLYFASPELFAFKMYVYALTYWNLENIRDRKFRFDLINQQARDQAREIAALYNSIPSTELWSTSLIDNTLNQIQYFSAVEQFENPEDALVLCDAVQDLMKHARLMAESGSKYLPGTNTENEPRNSFRLYYNEFSRTNDNVLVCTGQQKILFTTFGTPNFLSTSNSNLCDQMYEWFNSMISRSTALSVSSGRYRELFFNDSYKRIQRVKDHIQEELN